MAGKSDYAEIKVLDHIFGNTAFAQPAPYVALFTAAPSDAGGGTECVGTGYARQLGSFGNAAAGALANDSIVNFGTDTVGDYGTLTHFGIYDAVTLGNLLYWAALTTPKTPGAGDPVTFPIGNLTATED